MGLMDCDTPTTLFIFITCHMVVSTNPKNYLGKLIQPSPSFSIMFHHVPSFSKKKVCQSNKVFRLPSTKRPHGFFLKGWGSCQITASSGKRRSSFADRVDRRKRVLRALRDGSMVTCDPKKRSLVTLKSPVTCDPKKRSLATLFL